MFDPSLWSNEVIERHSVSTRQFIDFRESTLPNGMRIIDAYNSSGLHFTLLPDRGLDIWTAHYKGVPLTWISQGSPHPPDFGQSWLRQFNGGLLTTCGLTHVGPPETDETTGEFRDLHGRYSRLRASKITREHVVDHHNLRLTGFISQAELFGEQLQLWRSYDIGLGEPSIMLRDMVTNISDEPVPFMLLYHFNLGYPLVREGTQFYSASTVYPRDEAARAGQATWNHYESASPGYAEQVFLHHCKTDSHNASKVALINENFGLMWRWETPWFPYLTQWKNTRQGIYVSGVEPGNCIPEGRNAAQQSGRLVMLPPGETQFFECKLTILEGAEAVENARAEIDDLRTNGKPIENCNMSGYEAIN